MVIELLADKLCEENTHLDKTELTKDIQSAIEDERIKTIWKDNMPIGFLTWIIAQHKGERWIYIENLWIDKKYRKAYSLFDLRKYFRVRYPKTMFYWDRNKTGKYYYHR